MYWVIMLELGFYLHSIYATVYLETRRKDFTVMLSHHFVTVGLLFFAYIIRYLANTPTTVLMSCAPPNRAHIIGIMLLCLIDIGDFIFEFGKCILDFRDRNGRQYYWPEQVANVLFGVFAVQL